MTLRPAEMPMTGKWLLPQTQSVPFGHDNVTYELAMRWLQDRKAMTVIEDWGCGTAWAKRYLHPINVYIGVDGSPSPFADRLEDLRSYTSACDGLLLRHVLEHNWEWVRILKNALQSYSWRMCVVIFTPMQPMTREIYWNETVGVPSLGFKHDDLTGLFGTALKSYDDVKTKTQYGTERLYYLQKRHAGDYSQCR